MKRPDRPREDRGTDRGKRRGGPRGEDHSRDGILYGLAPVEEALREGKRRLGALFVREGKPSVRHRRILEAAAGRGLQAATREPAALGVLAGTRHHQGVVLQCGPLPTLTLDEWLPGAGERALVLALDRIEDPQNLGGLARTAAFLGADAMLLHRDKAAPLSAAASKASAGALERFPVVQEGNLARALERLRRDRFFVYGAALEEDAVEFGEAEAAPRTVLVVGNEGEGLRALTRKRCDCLLRIPGRAGTESLNVNVAAGILLRHLAAD